MIRQETADKIKFVSIMAFVVLLPVNKKLMPFIIALWLIVWLIEGKFKQKIGQLKKIQPFILLVTFYILHLLSLFYTENIKSGLFDIEVKLSLLILPLVVLNNKFIANKQYFNTIIKAFVLSNFVAVLFCFGQSLYRYLILNGELLYYSEFSIFHHTSYSSMYLLFSIAIIFYLITTKDIAGKKSMLFYSVVLLSMIAGIYFTSSKAGMISMFVLAVYFIYIYVVKQKRYVLSAIILVILAASIITGISCNYRFKAYYEQAGQTIKDFFKNGATNSTDERLQAWNVAIEISKKNIITGVGTGDVKDKLTEYYKKYNMTKHLEKKFNVHNQFLETYTGTGIAGFILLLLILLILMLKKNMLITSFGIIIIINFFFESMLNTQAGVTFFAFFYSLLIYFHTQNINHRPTN